MADLLKSRSDDALSFGRFEQWGEVCTDAIVTVDRAPLLSVKMLRTTEELYEHRTLWNWPGTRDSDLDFFLYFAGVRPEVLRPHVFVAHRGETPEAMLIGKLEHRPIPIQLGYLHLRTPRLRVLTLVYGGLRGSTAVDTTEALVKEVLKTLRRGEADVAVFEPLAVNSQLCHALGALSDKFERGLYCTRQNQYRMQLPASSRELLEMIPAKERRNYLRKGRKLVRDFSGDVSCQWYKQPSPAMYRDLEFVAQRSYQRGLGVGFEDTPELRGWWELAGYKGWLRVCILYVGGKPCAFLTGVAHSGILWGDYMAYNCEFASYSPGVYLLLRSLGELCACRERYDIREINLGPGDSDLKSLLNSSCKQETSVYVYPPTLKGVGLNLVLSLVLLADGLARSCMVRGSLLAKAAKRLRRKHASRNLASRSWRIQ